MFILSAFAETAESTAAVGSPLLSLVPIVVIFVIFYLLVIRPQNRKIKSHQEMINGLKVGDKVVTSGGIVGFITKVDEKNSLFHVEAAEGINIKIIKNSILEKLSKEKKND